MAGIMYYLYPTEKSFQKICAAFLLVAQKIKLKNLR